MSAAGAVNPETALEKQALLARDDAETMRATVAGVLLCTQSPEQWLPCACITALLQRHLPDTEAWAYGSRAKRTPNPKSDLDIVVFSTPDQRARVGDLREALEESNLPFRVDLFVWNDVPNSFRKQISANHAAICTSRRPQGSGSIEPTPGWRRR